MQTGPAIRGEQDVDTASNQPDSASQGSRGIRVVVRVRPAIAQDKDAPCTLLQCQQQGAIVLNPALGIQTTKEYSFDAALGPSSSQEDVYQAASIDELVRAASAGFNATVFAYGQTGSGKTHTMEGYAYNIPTMPSQGIRPLKDGVQRGPNPQADFDATPSIQLGIVPRAVASLFAHINQSTSRCTTVKVSFVQLYQEQVYDLLNPAASVQQAPGQRNAFMKNRIPGACSGGLGALGLPLRVRWSKMQDFYLENLFQVECNTAEEAMTAFRSGVTAKVMASHQLNATSSRSHALFTIQLDSYPLTCPEQLNSSRLTLVDLAGSERGHSIGASKGLLHEESVAINKSLFTLRQVILALSAQSSCRDGRAAAPAHVPYRDSKLTQLLKHMLGGNSVTTMVACVSCCDSAYEENASTLEYAALAKKVVNKVCVNEDPRSRIIRELRAEVNFLRAQLAAMQLFTSMAPHASSTSACVANSHTVHDGQAEGPARRDSADASHLDDPRNQPDLLGNTQAAQNPQLIPAQHPGSGHALHLVTAASGGQDMHRLLDGLLSSTAMMQQLSTAHSNLRAAYDSVAQQSEHLQVDNNVLMMENAGLRDRLSMLEATISGATGSVQHPQGDQAAALVELQELRQENALLHSMVQGSQGGRSGLPTRVARSGGNAAVQARPSTSQGLVSNTMPAYLAPLPVAKGDRKAKTGTGYALTPTSSNTAQLRAAHAGQSSKSSGGKVHVTQPGALDLAACTQRVVLNSISDSSRKVSTTGQLLQATSTLRTVYTQLGPSSVAGSEMQDAAVLASLGNSDARQADDQAARLVALVGTRNELIRARMRVSNDFS